MTRKDYIVIAAALKAAHIKIVEVEAGLSEHTVEELGEGVNYATDYIADALAKDNPRFDRARFLEAARA
jgi:hypothetical protein